MKTTRIMMNPSTIIRRTKMIQLVMKLWSPDPLASKAISYGVSSFYSELWSMLKKPRTPFLSLSVTFSTYSAGIMLK